MPSLHFDTMPRADQLDTVNGALLPVVRHFLDAFLQPDTHGWRIALQAAIGTWGDARGLSIANGVQVFLDAVLKYRPVPVSYIDPLDIDEREKLTSDEVDILALLTAMRSDKTEHARNIILRLTGGQIPNRIVETGLKLARQLDPVGQAIPRGRALRLELVTSHA